MTIKKLDVTDEFGMHVCNWKNCKNLTKAVFCSICAKEIEIDIYARKEDYKKELK